MCDFRKIAVALLFSFLHFLSAHAPQSTDKKNEGNNKHEGIKGNSE